MDVRRADRLAIQHWAETGIPATACCSIAFK
jgi:hypothetical protein